MSRSHSKTGARLPWLFASRGRLFFTLFFVLAIPTALLMALTGVFVDNLLTKQAASENLAVARLSARQVDVEFYGLRRYVESFASRQGLVTAITQSDNARVQQEIFEMVEQNKKITRAIFTDTNGTLLFDFPARPNAAGTDLSHREWLKGAAAMDRPYVSTIYQEELAPDVDIVAIATKVRDAEGNLLGYLAGKYEIGELAWSLDSTKTTGLGAVCLFDQVGTQALPKDGDTIPRIGQSSNIQSILMKEESWTNAPLDKLGECLVAHVPVPALGWTIVSYQPTAIILAPVQKLERAILLFFVVSLAALGVLGLFWLRLLYAYGEELRRSNQELERFCYSIAHDLRAPLRSMNGLTSALAEEYGDKLDDIGRDYTTRIATSSTRMDLLIQDLLEYGRIAHSSLDFQHIDLSPILQHVLFTLQDKIQDKKAKIEVKEPLGSVNGDAKLVADVFRQLVSNALKYTGPNVTPHLLVWSEEQDRTVKLFLRDNGIGIEREQFDRIFGVFERLHGYAVYSGTGIGLAIVKKAMERMRGKVGLESEIGRGSTFWIELPKK